MAYKPILPAAVEYKPRSSLPVTFGSGINQALLYILDLSIESSWRWGYGIWYVFSLFDHYALKNGYLIRTDNFCILTGCAKAVDEWWKDQSEADAILSVKSAKEVLLPEKSKPPIAPTPSSDRGSSIYHSFTIIQHKPLPSILLTHISVIPLKTYILAIHWVDE